MSDEAVIESPPPPADPAFAADERTMLLEFLEYYRAVLLRKCAGLTRAQMATRVGASSLTLAGLLKHMALVEHGWFHECWLGAPAIEPWSAVDWSAHPDWELDTAVDDDPRALGALYIAAVERSRTAIADQPDLGATVESRGRTISLRWILVHMIEEYARHCGHADLIRETVDGATGD